jgi:DNA topoisomerase-6 subunit B
MEKKASVLEYVKETAVVNPHASFVYIDPTGQKLEFKRVTDKLPKKAEKIKPHPYGIELGQLDRLLKETNSRAVKSFLTTEFDKVGSGTADEILKVSGLDPKISPKLLTLEQVDRLLKAMHGVKIMAPSTVCLSPIGADVLKKSLESEYDLEFAFAVTRPAAVYKGNPFVIEAAIGYGGELPKEEVVKMIRFANRVPLLYQQGACAITKAIGSMSWKSYGLNQSGSNLPTGPAIILVHVASVWAPFTSESKEAVAHIPEIIKETKLALQECGRHVQLFVGKRQKRDLAKHKKEMFENYSVELAISLSELTSADQKAIEKKLKKIAEEMLRLGTIEEEASPEEKRELRKRKVGAFKDSSDEGEE